MHSRTDGAPDGDAAEADAADGVGGRLVALAGGLRGYGLHVGTSEVTDAARVVEVLGLTNRARLRDGLAAAMLRRSGDAHVFEQLFDLYFPVAVGAAIGLPAHTVDELRERLMHAVATGDSAAIDAIARAAVEALGAVSADAQRGWSAAQTLDRFAPQRTIAGAQQLARSLQQGDPEGGGDGEGSGGGDGSGGAGGGGSGGGQGSAPGERLTDRIDRDEARRRVAEFRARVESETRRRNAEVRGRSHLAQHGIRGPVEQRDFLSAGAADLDELRRSIDPLAKKLATRLQARRRAGRGSIDVRRTLRASMSTGGVPITPVYAPRRTHRPDLVILADLSGSVGGFSTFTMLLMRALHAQFRRVQVFGFISSTADVTDVVRGAGHGAALVTWARRQPELTAHGSSSSYGNALRTFADNHLAAVGPRSTVLVLGDARTNFGDPRVDDLRSIRERARHVVWLNPEPATQWDSGDSVAQAYARVVDMHECRNLEQLRRFVGRVLPV
ncbi:VWA domain-containing protein [Leekyejoonella antrihumi]|uniref:VWA domain-containing protein n=1 Tax=Leekyejoonella antrihumi TaxID=1660198 RepID=A0A563DRN8_9MICO|nr:VWA domain-containing protein [Leekyejoonella antrihumi]TWP32601.1 VWA domain-containing protein [Leekyejoonella antrihumi]